MLKIYIDFDHTLFDTDKLKKECSRILAERFGCAPRAIHMRLASPRTRPFSPAHFAATLFHGDRVAQQTAARLIDTLLKESGKFLYADTIPFLEHMASKHTLVLYSYGNRAFQMKKIIGSGIQKYFKKIIITSKKSKDISFPKHLGTACIIDDRHEVVVYYAKKYGMQPFIIERKKQLLPAPAPYPVYRSLRAVQKTIEKMYL